MHKKILCVCVLLVFLTHCTSKEKSTKTIRNEDRFAENISQKEVINILTNVNNYWQTNNPEHGNAFWHRAAYHTGNMAAYAVTGNKEYLAYSQAWAEQNEWKGAKSNDRNNWKYSYGESDEYVLFGDWQICFQVYADLFNINPEPHKIERAIEVMEYQMSTSQNDYWWWADGLYMVMPVMTKLHRITSNKRYLEKLYDYFLFAKELMYDEESGLFYRDAKYIYPNHKTENGKKDFWARGNGWVFAGLAKTLYDLPEDDPHRNEYIFLYQAMAESLKASQQEGGIGHEASSILHMPPDMKPVEQHFSFTDSSGVSTTATSPKKHTAPSLKKDGITSQK